MTIVKLLRKNRRYLYDMMPVIYPSGCCMLVVVGISVINQSPPCINLDYEKYDPIIGYLLLYGGFVLLGMYLLDTMTKVLIPSMRDYLRKRKANNLLELYYSHENPSKKEYTPFIGYKEL